MIVDDSEIGHAPPDRMDFSNSVYFLNMLFVLNHLPTSEHGGNRLLLLLQNTLSISPGTTFAAFAAVRWQPTVLHLAIMADQPLDAGDRAKLSAGDSDRRCVLDLLKVMFFFVLLCSITSVGCGFNYFFISTPTWGNDPI